MPMAWCARDLLTPGFVARPHSAHFLSWGEAWKFDGGLGARTSAADFHLNASTLQNATMRPASLLLHNNMSRHLQVAVLGVSTTAGCGAAAPSPHCDIAISWGAHLAGWLAATLDGSGWTAHVSIWGKAGVTSAHFETCIADKLRGIHLVLLEFHPMLSWATQLADLDRLLLVIWRTRPRARYRITSP